MPTMPGRDEREIRTRHSEAFVERPSGTRMPVLNNLRTLIADDHEVMRRGLKALFSSRPGWILCAEATNGREAVVLAAQHRPDIVVMDISMPELSGLEATRQIRKMLPKTEVLVLSLHYSDQLVREIVDAGARAYVLKSDSSTEVLIAVEALPTIEHSLPRVQAGF